MTLKETGEEGSVNFMIYQVVHTKLIEHFLIKVFPPIIETRSDISLVDM